MIRTRRQLINQVGKYVSDDDGELEETEFIRTVAERITDDLGETETHDDKESFSMWNVVIGLIVIGAIAWAAKVPARVDCYLGVKIACEQIEQQYGVVKPKAAPEVRDAPPVETKPAEPKW